MSHVFHVTVPWQHCPFQRNSSGLGEEGDGEKGRDWEEEKRERRGMKWKTEEQGVPGRAAGWGWVAMSSRPVQSHVPPDPECEQGTSYAYFWYHQTLKASGRIEDGGPPAFNLGMFLLLAWCFVCVFTINGIKSFEKVSCTWPLAFSSAMTLFLPPGQLPLQALYLAGNSSKS